MTLSSDEPMLPQPDDENNSPMLNHNRLLMDVHAAYEAGWLLGLTERMSEAQKHRFREAITGQGLHYFWNSIIITDLMDEEQFFVYNVGEWVHEPTPANFRVVDDQLRSYILRWHDTDPLTLDDVYEALEWSDRPDDLANLCWCILAESLQDAARSAAELARMTITEPWREMHYDYYDDYDDQPDDGEPPIQPRNPLDDIPRRRAAAQRWQIEAAWAILHDDPLPPYPEFRQGGRGTQIIADLRAAYLAGNLRRLIGALDADRQARLWLAFLRLRVYLVERCYRYEPGSPLDLDLSATKQWMAQPNPWSVRHLNLRSIGHGPSASVGRLVTADLHVIIQGTTLEQAAFGSLLPLSTRIRNEYIRTGRTVASDLAALDCARRWQCEAAWALLQGREPPPIPEFALTPNEMSIYYRPPTTPLRPARHDIQVHPSPSPGTRYSLSHVVLSLALAFTVWFGLAFFVVLITGSSDNSSGGVSFILVIVITLSLIRAFYRR